MRRTGATRQQGSGAPTLADVGARASGAGAAEAVPFLQVLRALVGALARVEVCSRAMRGAWRCALSLRMVMLITVRTTAWFVVSDGDGDAGGECCCWAQAHK